MAKNLCALAALLWLPATGHAAWWVENNYAFGSDRFQKESLTFSAKLSPRVMSGVNASFYKDGGPYRDKVYSLRLPLMYSPGSTVLSVTPFLYPASSAIRSGARGAKAYALIPLDEDADESYVHLTLSGAAARQDTLLNLKTGPERTTFSETAFEAQVEKSFYNQFFFLASAAGFAKTRKARNGNLIDPVLDQGDLASLGTIRQVNLLPEWTAVVQFARNMAPDFDSYLYAGAARISFRGAQDANSFLGGLKMKLNDKSMLDFAYNFYKMNSEAGRNYYKLSIQVFF
ncbi:MAG: hypothetical protein WCW52_03825 [Elusimicrobiales bacterium]|jgi:hypothetical protein